MNWKNSFRKVFNLSIALIFMIPKYDKELLYLQAVYGSPAAKKPGRQISRKIPSPKSLEETIGPQSHPSPLPEISVCYPINIS